MSESHRVSSENIFQEKPDAEEEEEEVLKRYEEELEINDFPQVRGKFFDFDIKRLHWIRTMKCVSFITIASCAVVVNAWGGGGVVAGKYVFKLPEKITEILLYVSGRQVISL